MANFIKTLAVACGLAGILTIAAAAPASAQMYYGGPYGAYAGPYGGYAYAPRYRVYRDWDYPVGYDSSGMAFSYRDLGWQPGPPGTAPANPCTFGLRQQNRC